MAIIIYAGDGGIFKTCSKCDQAKAFSDFNKCKKETTGLRCECKDCQTAFNRQYALLNVEKERARSRRRHMENPAAAAARNRKWRSENREHVRARDNARNARNRETVNKTAKRHYEKKKKCPQFRLESAIKVGVHGMLKGTKSYRPTFKILGYSVDDLRSHLEAQFAPGMTWDNYGFYGWHVDHIIPRSAFKYASVNEGEFKKCWALSNLQPMWASENKSKGNKLHYKPKSWSEA